MLIGLLQSAINESNNKKQKSTQKEEGLDEIEVPISSSYIDIFLQATSSESADEKLLMFRATVHEWYQ